MRYVLLAALVCGCAWTNTGGRGMIDGSSDGCGLIGCSEPAPAPDPARERAKECVRITTDPAADPQAQLACEAFLARREAELDAERRQRQAAAAEDQARAQRILHAISVYSQSRADAAQEHADAVRRSCLSQPKRYESRCRPDGLGLGGVRCETVQVGPVCY